MSVARTYLDEVGQIANRLDADAIDAAAELGSHPVLELGQTKWESLR
jgi:hypothetical protein